MCEWGNDILVLVKITADPSNLQDEKWREFGIDACIAPIVRALQEGGIDMRASCCGHGRGPGLIELADGRGLIVLSEGQLREYLSFSNNEVVDGVT